MDSEGSNELFLTRDQEAMERIKAGVICTRKGRLREMVERMHSGYTVQYAAEEQHGIRRLVMGNLLQSENSLYMSQLIELSL